MSNSVFFFKKIFSPLGILENQLVEVKDGKIININNFKKGSSYHFAFDEHILSPGLINAHDHLLGTYFPRVGTRRPYINWKPWDDDLKNSDLYQERSKIENKDLYFLGSFKNLFSGVLTVSDHIPHIINDPFIDEMPIRIIKDYSVAHEISKFELPWGKAFDIEHQEALVKNQPFITHIEEGFDPESMRGIEYLFKKDSLTDHTVLIHAIGISPQDIEKIASKSAHVVWCPSSNEYMFSSTAPVKELFEAGVSLSLGTDSPMSGGINILNELKFAQNSYYDFYGESISGKTLFNMVTMNPAKAFRLDNKIGSIEEGKIADFLILKDDKDFKDPYLLFTQSDFNSIDFIFYNGKPYYAASRYKDVFTHYNLSWNTFNLDDTERIIEASWDPLSLIKKIHKNLGFKKEFPFLPIRY